MRTLLQRIADNDQTAVREVIDEYGGLIWRLARRYLDRAEREVEDAVQDVFVEIWLSAKRFDPSKGAESAFIATLAHRRLTDAQRRFASRARLATGKREQLHHGQPDSPDPIAGLVRKNETKRVAAMIDALPEDERRVIWMHVHGGMTHGQIAEQAGIPIGTVKSRLRRAMMRLTEAARQESDVLQGAQP